MSDVLEYWASLGLRLSRPLLTQDQHTRRGGGFCAQEVVKKAECVQLGPGRVSLIRRSKPTHRYYSGLPCAKVPGWVLPVGEAWGRPALPVTNG